LGVNGSAPATDLYVLLREVKRNICPERFDDVIAKKNATEKFDRASALLIELEIFVQIEESQKSVTDLALPRTNSEVVRLQSACDKLTEENESLRTSLNYYLGLKGRLEEKILQKEDSDFVEEKKQIEHLYIPSTSKVASLSLVAILSLASTVLAKLEFLSQTIVKYSPFSERTVSNIMFFIFLSAVFLLVKEYIEHLVFKRKSDEICSPRCA
jgi:hypothetical protein